MAVRQSHRRVTFFLLMALSLNAALWWGSRFFYAQWAGVPPVPSKNGAMSATLGDPEFSYRTYALELQNLGDSGGRTTPLHEYDYKKLLKWFSLLNDLNPASNHLPHIAAYYFGAIRLPPDVAAKNAGILIEYLARVGQNPAGEKWRYLAHAVYLAQHRVKDLNLALDLAYILSKMKLSDGRQLPFWAQQMPAFVLKEKGENEAAKELALDMLRTGKDLPPQEIGFLKSFLTEQLKVSEEDIKKALDEMNAPDNPQPE